ncbi:PadR family transcriptional regulator [Paenibacillus sp. MBLB4367]|uniref:PadR family transcriptional regulator n=1 Tax=Paenibacillus sp. MBLB4367 TaxID=3384767 RepID=UPI0039083A7D
MNTLSFGLLCMLSRGSYSGYDLMLKLQPFWQAKHSQIYPLLAKLDKEGYVEHIKIEQSDKPDKKVYSLTDKGREALIEWVPEPADEPPTTRDEINLKAYAMWMVSDMDTLRHLFEAKAAHHRDKLVYYDSLLNQVKLESGESLEEVDSKNFGRYILIRKAIAMAKTHIDWCEWVLSFFDRHRSREGG